MVGSSHARHSGVEFGWKIPRRVRFRVGVACRVGPGRKGGVKGVIVELGGGGHVVPIGGEVERSRPGGAALRGYRFARAVIWEAGLVGVGDADIVRILCPDGEMLVDD